MDIEKERKSIAAQYWYRSRLNVLAIWKLGIQYNAQIFVLVDRFYTLSTECQ